MHDFQLSRPPRPIDVFTLADTHVREVNEAARNGQRSHISKLERDLSRRVKAFAATLPEEQAKAFTERLSAELADMEREPVALGEGSADVIASVVFWTIIWLCAAFFMAR